MKNIKMLLCVAFAIFGLNAHAAELMFYERPVFMAETMPLSIKCKYIGPYSYTCFEDHVLPAMVNVKVVNKTDGGSLRVIKTATTYMATCSQGMCVSHYNQAPVGDVDFASLEGHAFTAQTFDGYYLDKDDSEHLVAYKRGFGPKADQYPPYAILKEPVQKMSSNTRTDTYDVWCSPQSDTCDFNGKQVPREELSSVIPKRTSEWCDNEFCYATEFFDGVIGINPSGFLAH